MIVDVWSSRAEVQRAIINNEDFQRKWQDAGWPRRDSRDVRSAQHGLTGVINAAPPRVGYKGCVDLSAQGLHISESGFPDKGSMIGLTKDKV
jgi:hypothetical protein